MPERLVVVGGDAAGMSAASNARRRRSDLEIVALERGRWTSYAACGIPYLVSGAVGSLDELVMRTPQEFRDHQRIDVRTEHEVVGVDTSAGNVTVRDRTRDREYVLGYDQLVLATGGSPTRPDVPGVDLPHVHGVQTLEDAQRLLDAAGPAVESVVVVGGGYVGLEMAEAFVLRGAEVTVVDRGPEVMDKLDPDMGVRIRRAMERRGIDVLVETGVVGFEEDRVLLDGGEALPADLVVLGTGLRPNADLAADAGIPTGHKGSVTVDHRQRTQVAGVWAAGDCADTFHRVLQRRVSIALGTIANRTGRVAGINVGGGYASFPGVVGTAMTRICDTEVATTGITEAVARDEGYEVRSTVIEATAQAAYYPGASDIAVKLVAEVGSDRILGGQIVGGSGSAQRIDTLATAITASMTVDDLVDLDTGYAPPFSPLWDPVATAARTLA